MGYEQPIAPAQSGITAGELQNSTYTYSADAEASDAYAIALSTALTSYVAGQKFTFKANTANTGGATLNVDSLGAKNILRNNDQALVTGDIEAGSIVTVVYDGTSFQMVSMRAIAPIANLSEDASPQLGGDLDAGANTVYFTEKDNGNSGTSKTIDFGLGNKHKLTLTGNATLTFTAPAGACSLILRLVQDGTGSRTVTFPASVKWAGGSAPTLTTTASATDIIALYWDGTSYHASSSLDLS